MNVHPLSLDTSLAQLPAGALACITEIRGDRSTARRLLSLGLRVGSVITVVQHRDRGVVVACAGSRVALGESVARMLVTRRLDSTGEATESPPPAR